MLLSITTEQRRWCAMISEALPVGSLRGRPASLRTFPEWAGYRLPKPLIWRMLSAIGPAFAAEAIFLPALREAHPRGCAGAAGSSARPRAPAHGGGEGDHTGRALRRQRGYLEHRIERIAGMD